MLISKLKSSTRSGKRLEGEKYKSVPAENRERAQQFIRTNTWLPSEFDESRTLCAN